MRIAFLIGELMMDAVRRHPENRPAFERERRANGQEILHPLRRLISAMREQPVITHADAQAARNPPQEHRDEQSLPGEKEERRYRAHVKRSHEAAVIQFTSSLCSLCSFQILQFHMQRRVPVPVIY